ncbi:Testis-specific H1 histone [Heterocephalus glaber]|uniref:Testis-specific H1 histone n=1 Tax=Heterocephalus glaber TaxID=10181 RepID=G5BK96_HETGA|nr:Testis-specific H1 histone [Heterocephalus glaber]
MAAAARPSAESQGADMSAQRPAGRALGGLLRGIQSSVLRVSQVVLRAITAHKGLTLTALRKELAKAGYEVRRQGLEDSEAKEKARTPEAGGGRQLFEEEPAQAPEAAEAPHASPGGEQGQGGVETQRVAEGEASGQGQGEEAQGPKTRFEGRLQA